MYKRLETKITNSQITKNNGNRFETEQLTKMKNSTTILKNIANDKELQKGLSKLNHFSNEDFFSHAKDYIKAIKDGRMFCVIDSVSGSGMSRNIHFHSAEKTKNRFYFRQYWALFTALGYTKGNNSNNFRISGCGMDMIFHTNYTNIHVFKRLGFLTDVECSKLCQMTPTTI